MDENKTIYFSILRLLDKAQVYGKLDTRVISILRIISTFYNDEDFLKDNYEYTYSDIKSKLKALEGCLKDSNQKDLCLYTDYTNVPVIDSINTPPRISDSTLVSEDDSTVIPISKFLTDYIDDENDSWSQLVIYSYITDGEIYYNGVPIVKFEVIDISGIPNTDLDIGLEYIRPDKINREPISDEIAFKIRDDNSNPLLSDVALVNVNVLPKENLPPIIGDIDLVVEYNTRTVLTYDIFLNQMDPSYSDPEGDEIDAIRIDRIPTNNRGIFVLDQSPVANGTIISADMLRANRLAHLGPDDNAVNTDYFEFSVRDVGSLIWVS